MNSVGKILGVTLAGIVSLGCPAGATTTDPGVEAGISVEALYNLAEEFRRNGASPENLQESARIHADLVERGHAPSMHSLALAHFRGQGVELDRERAVELLRAAVAAGNIESRVWLGRALMVIGGHGEEAYRILSMAVVDGMDGAEYHYALGHVESRFEALSNPEFGVELLSRLSAEGNPSATYELATAYRRGTGTPVDGSRARLLFGSLVVAGDAQSAERLAEMLRDGEGGPQDLARAEALFASAFENGRASAGLKLAGVLLEVDRPAEARAILVTAAEQESVDAQLQLALGDISGAFGAASRAQEGQEMLEMLVESSDPFTANRLARQALRAELPKALDLEKIAATLDEAAQAGDGRSAERLVRLLRILPDWFENSLQRRSDALAAHGSLMAQRIYFDESVRAILETERGRQAGALVVELLADADPQGFEAGLLAAFATSRNGYVYLLQSELRRKGVYSGQLTGLADRATLSAVMGYCRDHGLSALCAQGPLRKDVASALAVALSAPEANARVEPSSDG